MTAPTCSSCKFFTIYKVEDLDGFTREYTFCHILGSKYERLPDNTCKRHKTL